MEERKMTKVMVVDDEQDLRDMINLMLKKEGYETETARDGNELLEKIDVFQPDLVTLDVMMPGLTTKEILEKIKEKKNNPKILLLTVVRFSEAEKERIMNMGNVVGYITKPFEFDDLLNSVRKHVQ